jgi:hypothetical protein
MYAGLPESEEVEKRTVHGIPFHPEVIEWFKDICGELSIPYTLS